MAIEPPPCRADGCGGMIDTQPGSHDRSGRGLKTSPARCSQTASLKSLARRFLLVASPPVSFSRPSGRRDGLIRARSQVVPGCILNT